MRRLILRAIMIRKIFVTALVLASLKTTFSEAQIFTKRDRYTTFGLSATAANYFGDLTPGPSIFSTDPELTRFSVGAFAVRRFYPRLSGRLAFTFGRITGDDGISASSLESEDAGRWQRNLSFRNDIKELSAVLLYDLSANYRDYKKRANVTPYFLFGVAVFHHRPKAFYDGGRMAEGWYDLQPLQTEGRSYSKIQLSIPFGGGLKFKISQQMDLGLEFGLRKTFTDYLDDVSTEFADKGDLNSSNGEASWILSDRSIELAAFEQPAMVTGSDGNQYPVAWGISNAGLIRGDKTDHDWYVFSGFTLTYVLDPARKTPKFR